MKKEELLDKAEAYHKGQLSKEEKIAFEKELAKNDALAEEVKIYSRIIEANSEKDVIGLRGTMKGILREQQHEQQVLAKKGNLKWGLLIAVVILLAAFIYIMVSRGSNSEPQEKIEDTTNNQELLPSKSLEQSTPATNESESSTPEKEPDAGDDENQPVNSGEMEDQAPPRVIAMAYYEIPESIRPENAKVDRDVPPKDSSRIERARVAFMKGLNSRESNKERSNQFFLESIMLLDPLIAKNQNEEAVYYRAHAKFQLTEYSEASKGFEAAIKSRQFKEEAAWNLILTNLIIGTEYQGMLKSITGNPGHKFYDKAVALDKALSN